MSSSKLAALLRVIPKPTTLAESSAIFKTLKTKAKLSSFLRFPTLDKESSACFYIAFSRQSPDYDASKPLEVPVYHNQLDPRDEDPFNIRGLQDRKPSPKPLTFRCSVEALTERESEDIKAQIQKDNKFHGSFITARKEKDDWLQMVVRETGAPNVIVRGLGQSVEKEQQHDQPTVRGNESDRKRAPTRVQRLRTDSLLKRADQV